jgi:hypothetical protein
MRGSLFTEAFLDQQPMQEATIREFAAGWAEARYPATAIGPSMDSVYASATRRIESDALHYVWAN